MTNSSLAKNFLLCLGLASFFMAVVYSERSKADLVAIEMPIFLGGRGLNTTTYLEDVKPTLVNVTITTDCYMPGIVGFDNEFNQFNHTIAETFTYYFNKIPSLIDESNHGKRFEALLDSIYLIVDHVLDCDQKSQGPLGLTAFSALTRLEQESALG